MKKEFDKKKKKKKKKKNGYDEIWVTPKIPFMIPLLIGFILTFILGDIMFYLMSLTI